MKFFQRIFISTICLFSAYCFSDAQLQSGMTAEDFEVVALNSDADGKPYHVHLYDWLDQGKYVFLDFSAAWCGPCWDYHKSGVLDSLWKLYGPGTQRDDIRCAFLEVDPLTADSLMYGHSTKNITTMGNWMKDPAIPMCNLSPDMATKLVDLYDIEYEPIIYLVCPDRTLVSIDRYSTVYTANYRTLIDNKQCPTKYPLDLVLKKFEGTQITADDYAEFYLTITNRGWNKISTFNIVVTNENGDKCLDINPTVDLDGNSQLNNFKLELPNLPKDTKKLKVLLNHPDDTFVGNNGLYIPIYAYYSDKIRPAEYFENFESCDKMPEDYGFDCDFGHNILWGFVDGTIPGNSIIGSDGTTTKSIRSSFAFTDDPTPAIISIGAFDVRDPSYATLSFEFDMAYARNADKSDDKVEVVVSNDGRNWRTKYSKSGKDLSTTADITSGFVPATAEQWRHEKVDLGSELHTSLPLVIGIRGISGHNGHCYFDNLKLIPAAVNDVPIVENPSVELAPNPTEQFITVFGYDGEAKIVDVYGRELGRPNIVSGEKTDVGYLSPGLYFVKLPSTVLKFIKK